ncbi:ribbon-helix-helix domain-containing protein [Bacillus atrophaeus]|uniref:ribbon-helix-helix domain-containing protein n=1 Tax=Bacillus atrophaeus TaxID=1452 RepID=UPI002E1BA0FD|nr:Arc family DNA-binding protein [Bacillus atrophaeus]
MPINRDTHTTAQTVLTKEVYDKLQKEAKKNKRSVSAQIAYMVEQSLDAKEDK